MSAPGARASDGFGWAGLVLAIVFLLFGWLWVHDYRDQAIPQDLRQKVPRTSPFIEQRHQSPPSGDMATPLAIASVLAATGHSGDAQLLRGMVQRRALKALLDERYQAAGTIDAAIRQEAVETESVDALRGRARALVRFERVPGPDGEPSTTRDNEGRDALHVRFRVSNQLARPVTPVLRFDDSKLGAYLHVRCTVGSGAPVPARDTAYALCSSVHAPSRFAAATAYVLRKDAVKPIALRLEFDDVVVTEHFVLPSGLLEDDGERAWREVTAADCHALSACEEIARRKQADFHRRIPQRLSIVFMLCYAALLWLWLLRKPPGPVEERSLPVSILAGGMLALFAVSTLLLYGIQNPEIPAAVLVYGGWIGALLILVALQLVGGLVLAAVLARRPAERTRLRSFALYLSAAALSQPILMLTR